MTSPKLKVVFIGNASVGKTALFHRFQNRHFSPDLRSTVGGACANVVVPLPDNTEVTLIVWDTAGQETYRGIVPMYFTRSHFILIVYDITNRSTYDSVVQWAELSRSRAGNANIVLIGNKSDLEHRREVPIADGRELAMTIDAYTFLETSAVNGKGIDELLQSLGSAAKLQVVNCEPGETAIARTSDQKEDNPACCG
jgi:small GTP-binding protein